MKFLSVVGLLALSSALPSATATPSSKHHPLPVDYQSFTPLQSAALQAPTEVEYQSLFSDFVKRHNKEYATHEKTKKYNVFKENAEKVCTAAAFELTDDPLTLRSCTTAVGALQC